MSALDDIVGGQDDEELELDLSGAVEFEPLKGDYAAKIVSAEAVKSKAGNPAVKWEFEITEPGQAAGWKRKRTTPLNGKGSGLTKQVIKAAGFGEDVEGDDKPRIKLSKYIGAEVTLVMGPQPDSEFDEIKRVNAPKESSGSALD